MLSKLRIIVPALRGRAATCALRQPRPRARLRRIVTALSLAIPSVSLRAQGVGHAGARVAPAPIAPSAEAAPAPASLDSLIALARKTNPRLRAARARVEGAGALVGPAGARPDPMLMAGLQNVPVSGPAFGDMMTMKMIGVSQMLPYPGKLALRTRAAESELVAANARLADAELGVVSDVQTAFYDLAFADRALDVVQRNAGILESLIAVTEAKYRVGDGTQADVLRARVEAADLGNQASALVEQRRADLARLNALLDRPSDAPVEGPVIPQRIARAAVADSTDQIRFVSAVLGARATDSPLLPLDSLQSLAAVYNPLLKADDARISAQVAAVELSRKAHLPDFDVSLSYGQRQGMPDMVSAIVSVPIPLQKGRKQDAEVVGAGADLAALKAERRDDANSLRATIARQESAIERARTDLALYVKAILPQAQATLASATASYQVGRLDFTTVIGAQATLFNYEVAYYRSLTDFAKALASLQQTVGTEVLR